MREFSRLKWLCRRGIKELDVILTAYLESDWVDAGEEEKQAFATLLSYDDPYLFSLLLGSQRVADPDQQRLLGKLRHHVLARRTKPVETR